MIFEGFRKALPSEEKGYFALSGIREATKLDHTPLLVIHNDSIKVCYSAADLLENYPPEADVIAQWRGHWRSDYFHFKVADFFEHIAQNPPTEHQVV